MILNFRLIFLYHNKINYYNALNYFIDEDSNELVIVCLSGIKYFDLKYISNLRIEVIINE